MQHNLMLGGEFPLWSRFAVIVTVVLTLRLAIGYAGAPSVDDFCYLPLAWLHIDPTLFAHDDMLRGFLVHVPLWPPLVFVLEKTVGLTSGLFLLTVLLSVATVAAAWRIYRAAGGAGWLFPAAALLAFAGRVSGIGRGEYGGALGDQFHMQWLALCLLLWVFERFMARSVTVAALLLGAAFYAHPVVAAHGAIVLFVASLFRGRRGLRPLLLIAGISAAAAAPVLAVLARETFVSAAVKASCDVAKDGYLFRTPQEYSIRWDNPLPLSLMLLLVTGGLSSFMLPAKLRGDRDRACQQSRRDLGGICAGLSLLVVSAIVVNGGLFPAKWLAHAVWLFQLHLSRSSPLLLVMTAVALVSVFDGAANEEMLTEASSTSGIRWFWLTLMVTFTFLLVVQVLWIWPLALLLGGSLLARLTVRNRWRQVVSAGMLVLALFAGIKVVRAAVLDTPVEAEKRMLFDWAKSNTLQDALFITPPGLEEFRFYTRRSQYVDFKTFPASRGSLICEWRRRMTLVAAPDKQALESNGWPGVIYWDRSYAVANTQSRVATLLSVTRADYLVYDRHGLEVPPFLDIVDVPDNHLQIAYENSRFRVYRLRPPGNVPSADGTRKRER